LSHKRSTHQLVSSDVRGAYDLFAHLYLLHLRAHYPNRRHVTSEVPLLCQLVATLDGS